MRGPERKEMGHLPSLATRPFQRRPNGGLRFDGGHCASLSDGVTGEVRGREGAVLSAQREGVAGAPALQIFPEAPLAFFCGRGAAAGDGRRIR
jgi:hypothetical protein